LDTWEIQESGNFDHIFERPRTYTKNISPVQKSCFSTPLVLQTCGKEIDAYLSKRSFLNKNKKEINACPNIQN
jgi:hypothetical protein